MNGRAKLRYAYDAAEYRLLAARALLLAARTDAEADEWSDESLRTVAEEEEAVRSAERTLERAREACETHSVTVNPHPALCALPSALTN